jgi:hypothetical protein
MSATARAEMDDFGLEQADHRLGESVIVRIANTADGRLDACLGEALGIANADVLRAAVGMADEVTANKGAALVQGLIQGIEHELRPGLARHAPAHDPAGEDVDHEGVCCRSRSKSRRT